MSSTVYLVIMLTVIGIAAGLSLPSLLFSKCAKCGKRNGVDAAVCKHCGAVFNDEAPKG